MESQKALKKFHQTLKTMIKMYCIEHSREWDEGIHLLLFAICKSVQESYMMNKQFYFTRSKGKEIKFIY